MDKVSSIFATEIKIDEAKNFWNEAKSASIFCHPSYLLEMGYKFKYFGAYKGDELLCVWPLLIEQEKNSFTPNFSYFFGPFFKHDSADLPSYKSFSNNLKLINCLIKCVISESNNLLFSLLPEFQDIRPFSWWNYNKPDLPKFQIEVRYTARLDLSQTISHDDFQNRFRPDDKRKKLKKLRKEEPFISKTNHFKDHNILVKLYEDTLARSGASTTAEDSKILKKLISLSQTKSPDINCWVIEAYEKNSETLAGFQLLLGSKKSMYAIAQCAKSDYQKLNINTFLTYESLLFSKLKGYKYFDFNGANSPNRADEKHSYGAVPKSYFQITYKN